MSILSANTLFHFTPKLDWLISIIKQGFIPRFSGEFDNDNNIFKRNKPSNNYGMSVPMVCFCDIPLSQLKNHIATYGQYGIGLEKGWGISEGLSPVFYLTKESKYLNDYLTALIGAEELVWDFHFTAVNGRARFEGEKFSSIPYKDQDRSDLGFIASLIKDRFRRLTVLKKYYKPYSGSFVRDGKVMKDYSYYDEREWRFIPTFNMDKYNLTVPNYVIEVAVMSGNNRESIEKLLLQKLTDGLNDSDLNSWFTPQATINNQEHKNKLNVALEISPEFHLLFELDKVKYIVLKDDSEINQLISTLKRLQILSPERYTDESINLLTTKIITCKQIHEDF